jgi:hypothetical protein
MIIPKASSQGGHDYTFGWDNMAGDGLALRSSTNAVGDPLTGTRGGNLSAKDKGLAKKIDALMSQSQGKITQSNKDGTVTILKNGNKLTGTIATGFGSVTFSGVVSSTRGKPEYVMNSIRWSASSGLRVTASPGWGRIFVNADGRLAMQFDRNIQVGMVVFGVTVRTKTVYTANSGRLLVP